MAKKFRHFELAFENNIIKEAQNLERRSVLSVISLFRTHENVKAQLEKLLVWTQVRYFHQLGLWLPKNWSRLSGRKTLINKLWLHQEAVPTELQQQRLCSFYKPQLPMKKISSFEKPFHLCQKLQHSSKVITRDVCW